MIKIKIPNNNINERKYILDIIFNEFLGLSYELEIGSENYEIIVQNKRLIIIDSFFNKFQKDLEYLNIENIPKKVEFLDNKFTSEKKIPVLFGNSICIINNETIVCELDIFASSFFMLTRWEEYVNKNIDSHNRFPATESLAFKNNFLDRAIVNEYIEILQNMLLKLDSNLELKIKKSQLYISHDIDELYMYKSWKQVFRICIADILKRRSVTLAFKRIIENILINRNKIKDPFDTFDWLMNKSEAVGIQSRFYFMSGGVTSYDNRYKIDDKVSLELIKKIKKRGHIIGIHPSYNAYVDTDLFNKEKKLLEKIVEEKIVEGREHYLRFEVPTTWQVWEDNGMEIDSTCGYADKEGFRCGTGDEYSVFNILTRKKLNLKERPLVFMDGRDFNCGGYTCDSQFKHNAFKYIEKMKNKNYSSVTILFHNCIFKREPLYINEYDRILNVRY